MLNSDLAIEKSKLIYGELFDYSKFVYIGSRSSHTFICTKHNVEFSQRLDNHWLYNGCELCQVESRNEPDVEKIQRASERKQKTSEKNIIRKIQLENKRNKNRQSRKRKNKKSIICRSLKIHGNVFNFSKFIYVGRYDKFKLTCKGCRSEFITSKNNLINDKCGCKLCNNKKREQKQLLGKFNKLSDKSRHFYDLLSEKYKNIYEITYCDNVRVTDRFNCKCKTCNREVSLSIANLMRGLKKCRTCTAFARRKQLQSYNIDYDKYDMSEFNYKGADVKSKVVCKKCKKSFSISIVGLLKLKCGCILCNNNNSSGETIMKKFFDTNNIKYEYQKRFNDCRNKKPLPFDFYLPDYNMLIEYHGLQHFEFIEYFHKNKDELTRRQMIDNIKKQYASNRNKYYVMIRYDENLLDILERMFLGKIFISGNFMPTHLLSPKIAQENKNSPQFVNCRVTFDIHL